MAKVSRAVKRSLFAQLYKHNSEFLVSNKVTRGAYSSLFQDEKKVELFLIYSRIKLLKIIRTFFHLYCTISTKCSRFWEIFHAEMAEIFSFDLRRIKKNTF